MGGVLSAIYAALHADGPLKNLVCFTTPIDFKKMSAVRRRGPTSGTSTSTGWSTRSATCRPTSSSTPSTCCVRRAGWRRRCGCGTTCGTTSTSKSYRMMDRWSAETLPLAGEYFRQTVKELMWKNGLHEGTLRVGGQTGRPGQHQGAAAASSSPSTTTSCRRECARPLVAARRLARQGGSDAAGRPRQPGGRAECGQAHVAEARSMAGERST